MKAVLNGLVLSDAPDANGTVWIMTGMDGWDSPSTNQNFMQPTTQDGEVATMGKYGARSLSISGVAKAKSEADFWAAYYEIGARCIDLNTPFEFTVYEGLVPKTLYVVRSGSGPRISFRGVGSFVFELGLYAADPVKYGPAAAVTLAPGQTASAFNDGMYDTLPRMTVGGTVSVHNLTSGLAFRAGSDATPVPTGSVADFKAKTLLGSNGTSHFSKIGVTSAWWDLQPGTNSLKNFGDQSVTVTYRPAWI